MQFLSFLFALLKALPILDKWAELFVIQYTEYKRNRLIEINRRIIEESLESKDQRKLESPEVSGNPSGHGHIVSELPRMRNKKQD